MREPLHKIRERRERRRMTRGTSWFERHIPALAMSWWSIGVVLCVLNVLWMMLDAWGVIRILLPISNAVGLGACLTLYVRAVRERQREKLVQRMPARVSLLERSDDEQRVAVTRNNGETFILSMPPDYDPREDSGELLLRMVLPEVFDNEHMNVDLTIERADEQEGE